MEISMDKYRFYTSKNKVVAVSTYAGRPVRGVAKCDPLDVFSLEDGKKLAVARCNEKVAHKRLNRAKNKMAEAEKDLLAAKAHYEKMQKYFTDSQESCSKAQNYTMTTLSEML